MSRIGHLARRVSLGGAGVLLAAAGVFAAGSAANAAESGDLIPSNAVESGKVAADSTTGGEVSPLTTEYPAEGGTWNYGTTGLTGGGTVYSDYLHNSRAHGSTVENADGLTDRSPTAVAGAWSHAEAPAVAWAVDYAYYWLV